jgi:hypothetical protein
VTTQPTGADPLPGTTGPFPAPAVYRADSAGKTSCRRSGLHARRRLGGSASLTPVRAQAAPPSIASRPHGPYSAPLNDSSARNPTLGRHRATWPRRHGKSARCDPFQRHDTRSGDPGLWQRSGSWSAVGLPSPRLAWSWRFVPLEHVPPRPSCNHRPLSHRQRTPPHRPRPRTRWPHLAHPPQARPPPLRRRPLLGLPSRQDRRRPPRPAAARPAPRAH